jgi:release factor glutamine methyltransferase
MTRPATHTETRTESSTVAQLLAQGIARLGRDFDGAAFDTRILLAEALGCSAARLTAASQDMVPAAQARWFLNMITARAQRQPVSHILGRRAFWNHDFRITGDVLDPRPETELLVEVALRGPQPGRILDLGVGSGCILLSLLDAWPAASGTGTDISPAALEVARHNAEVLGLLDRVEMKLSDWLQDAGGPYDLVVCNPPYIAAAEMPGLERDVRDWEPHLALSPGGDGLLPYRVIAGGLGTVLAPGGRAIFEFGATQGRDVKAIFDAAGFTGGEILKDLNGLERVLHLKPRA